MINKLCDYKFCNHCKCKLISNENWYLSFEKSGKYMCKKCHNEYEHKRRSTDKGRKQTHIIQTRYYKKNKTEIIAKAKENKKVIPKIIAELKVNGCAICGYNKCNSTLSFHHTDPKDKCFQISHGNIMRTDSKLVDELNKCILLCANCHMEIEEKERLSKGKELK